MVVCEPLDNYDNTVKFLRLVSSPDNLNIGLRHISVSSCGLVDKIDALAKEELPISLSISLHAYDDEVRSEIMPINKKFSIHELLSACQRYFDTTGIVFTHGGAGDQNKKTEDKSCQRTCRQKPDQPI